MAKNIFLRVQMAAEKEGKLQRRIFSPFSCFSIMHTTYLMTSTTMQKKRKRRRCLNLDLPLHPSLRILLRGLLQRKQLRYIYNRARSALRYKKSLLYIATYILLKLTHVASRIRYNLCPFVTGIMGTKLIQYRRHIWSKTVQSLIQANIR